jgi:phosphoglycolate phosphatase
MKKTIIFDFDGVIADTLNIAFEIAKINYPSLTIDSYKDKWKVRFSEVIFTEPKVGPKISFDEEYAKKVKDLKIDPLKKEILQKLSKDFDFHIISGNNSKTIREFCISNNIDYFIEIMGNDVDVSKVNKFNTLFKKYNLNPKDLIFITDTAGDIIEAKEVGIKTVIAITSGFQDEVVLREAEPTYLIDSILDLKKIIL